MTLNSAILDAPSLHQGMLDRLRQLGIVLLQIDRDGVAVAPPPPDADWLSDLLVRPTLIHRHLQQVVSQWAGQTLPKPIEAFPGVWFIAIPLGSRREHQGFIVAVIVTQDIIESEQLAGMCQAVEFDLALTRMRLLRLPPVERNELKRVAALVQIILEHLARKIVDDLSLESMSQQLAGSYEEINLLYTITQSITEVDQPDRFIQLACDELLGTMPYRWIGALINHHHDGALKRLDGRLILAGNPPRSLEDMEPRLQELLDQAQPETPRVLEPETNPDHKRYAMLGNSALIHPIAQDGAVIGLFIAADKQGRDPIAASSDMKLLGATASHTGIFLENAALYDDLSAMFLGTLEALTASIDAKDPYTCGHSQRVAHLSKQLAAAIGLDEHTVERMHIAGIVHDVGKIGVPESVLTKPGRLTDEEFLLIRKHPEIGHRILKDIPQLQDILPGVLYHHERWDGDGYPHGLVGENIPLIARIICLADSFDAMSSTRTYRARLSRDEVLAEISRCAGAQFDAQLAEVFITLDFTEYDRFVVEHRAHEGIAAKPQEKLL